jgi:hypothetical protein
MDVLKWNVGSYYVHTHKEASGTTYVTGGNISDMTIATYRYKERHDVLVTTFPSYSTGGGGGGGPVQISAQRMAFLIECSHGYPLSREENVGIVHQIRSLPFCSKSFPIHCSLTTL